MKGRPAVHPMVNSNIKENNNTDCCPSLRKRSNENPLKKKKTKYHNYANLQNYVNWGKTRMTFNKHNNLPPNP